MENMDNINTCQIEQSNIFQTDNYDNINFLNITNEPLEIQPYFSTSILLNSSNPLYSVSQSVPKSISLLNIVLKQKYSIKNNVKNISSSKENVIKLINESEKFYDFLTNIIDDEIKYMEENNRTTGYYRKINDHVIKYSNKWYIYMYGYSKKNNADGDRKIYKENKISMPFYQAQLYCAERGYKLIDCTDTSVKKWSTFIVIATKDKIMDQEKIKIKHGFNKLSSKANKILYGSTI